MQEQKLWRLSEEEQQGLMYFRTLPPEDQKYLLDLCEIFAERHLANRPTNVVLLADPTRKFCRR